MLRTIFVLAIAAVGAVYAFQGAIYGLLFYLWVAYFRPEQWVWNGLIASLNLSYLTGICTIAAAIIGGARWPVNLRVGLLGLFLLHTLASVALAAQPGLAWPYWIEFLKVAVIAYLMVTLVTDMSRLRLVLLVIALSLGFEAAKQGWAEMLRHPGAMNTNPLPMLGDNNGVAVGMLMLVPILTTLGATAGSRFEKSLHSFLALGVLYRGIATYSRGGFLAAGALGLVYLMRSSRRLVAIVGIVLALLIIVPVMPSAFWARMNTITVATSADEISDTDTSALSRLHFWQVALRMANAQPAFGVGYASYNVNYDRYDTSNGEFGHNRSVHSAWFGILAELGYPGLLMFVAQLLLAFRACWRARRVGRTKPEFAMLVRYAFALEASLVAFIVGGTFLPFQYTEMLWHVLALSIALNGIAERALAGRTEELEGVSARARWAAHQPAAATI